MKFELSKAWLGFLKTGDSIGPTFPGMGNKPAWPIIFTSRSMLSAVF